MYLKLTIANIFIKILNNEFKSFIRNFTTLTKSS